MVRGGVRSHKFVLERFSPFASLRTESLNYVLADRQAHRLRVCFANDSKIVTAIRSRPILRWLHIVSLFWGILTELLPWPCPLTLLESWLEGKAGVQPDQGGFLLYYLDKLVYPDISSAVLTTIAVIVCAVNLAFYGWACGLVESASDFVMQRVEAQQI